MSRPRRAATLADAVSGVSAGQSVAMGGFTVYRRPVGLALALGPEAHHLTLVGNTLSIETDMLLHLGKVARVRASMVSLEGFGLSPVFRAAVEAGRIDLVEETEASISLSLMAERAQMPSLPWLGLCGSDLLPYRPDIHAFDHPATGLQVIDVPAFAPDWLLVHALEVDENGNAHLGAEHCIDVELAEAARTTVVSAERIVPPGGLVGEADIWGGAVDVIVEAPLGAFPTSCFPEYPVAGHFLLDWMDGDRRDALMADATALHGVELAVEPA